MNFKFLLFKKEFLFGFCFCVISLICVFGYSVWYGIGLNVKGQAQDLPLQDENIIEKTDIESVPTECNTIYEQEQSNMADTGPAPINRHCSLF